MQAHLDGAAGAALKAALAPASFMPEGGQVGCALTHVYPVAASKPFEPLVLRGADAAITAAAAQLGLKAKVICSYMYIWRLHTLTRQLCCSTLPCILQPRPTTAAQLSLEVTCILITCMH